jgi:hypothetical protein
MTTKAPGGMLLELHVGELAQLFNKMDPAPFRDRDLDPQAEEYIVEWSREVPPGVSIALTVHLDREPATPEAAAVLRQAMHAFFALRALTARRQLRQLLRNGRLSLVIALAFLAGAVVLGNALSGFFTNQHYGQIMEEGLIIGGWVAMWRPLEIFLYGWWPIRREIRLYDRLSTMAVTLVDASAASSEGPCR